MLITLGAALHWAAHHFHYLFTLIPIVGIVGNPVTILRQRFSVKGNRRQANYKVNIPILPNALSVPFKVIEHVSGSAIGWTPIACVVTSPTVANGLTTCTIGLVTEGGAAKNSVVLTIVGQ